MTDFTANFCLDCPSTPKGLQPLGDLLRVAESSRPCGSYTEQLHVLQPLVTVG